MQHLSLFSKEIRNDISWDSPASRRFSWNIMLYLLFLKKRQNLKLSSAANYRWRFMGYRKEWPSPQKRSPLTARFSRLPWRCVFISVLCHFAVYFMSIYLRSYKFSILQCPVLPYVNPTNHAPWNPNWPLHGGHLLPLTCNEFGFINLLWNHEAYYSDERYRLIEPLFITWRLA